MKRGILVLALTLAGFCADSQGKAYFFKRSELIERSVAIAVIELGEPKDPRPEKPANPFSPSAVKGETWSYSQRARAKTVKVIKGKLPKTFFLHGGENFICAQCQLAKGKYLAFLTRDQDFWVGANWHLSLRPIEEGKVQWYVSEEQRFPMEFRDLEAVIGDIQKLLAKGDQEAG